MRILMLYQANVPTLAPFSKEDEILSKPTWKMKHANSILVSFEHLSQALNWWARLSVVQHILKTEKNRSAFTNTAFTDIENHR